MTYRPALKMRLPRYQGHLTLLRKPHLTKTNFLRTNMKHIRARTREHAKRPRANTRTHACTHIHNAQFCLGFERSSSSLDSVDGQTLYIHDRVQNAGQTKNKAMTLKKKGRGGVV